MHTVDHFRNEDDSTVTRW